jgi:hypothetical protein
MIDKFKKEIDSLDFLEEAHEGPGIFVGEELYRLHDTNFYFSYWPEDGFADWREIYFDYKIKKKVDINRDIGYVYENSPSNLQKALFWHLDLLEGSPSIDLEKWRGNGA